MPQIVKTHFLELVLFNHISEMRGYEIRRYQVSELVLADVIEVLFVVAAFQKFHTTLLLVLFRKQEFFYVRHEGQRLESRKCMR